MLKKQLLEDGNLYNAIISPDQNSVSSGQRTKITNAWEMKQGWKLETRISKASLWYGGTQE